MTKDNYSEAEAGRRFEAALRGARLAQPSPLKDIPKKSGESRARGPQRAVGTAKKPRKTAK